MGEGSREEVLRRIRSGLGRSTAVNERGEVAWFPVVDLSDDPEEERKALIDRFIEEVSRVSGKARVITGEDGIRDAVIGLVDERGFHSFSMWESGLLSRLNLRRVLESRRLRPVSPDKKEEMAGADIGITEADFAIADTGTLVLIAKERQPRSVSLIPPIHIVVLDSRRIVRSIHDLFAVIEPINKDSTSCMTFITGPSRTADIELNLTLGVHGPRELFVLIHTI